MKKIYQEEKQIKEKDIILSNLGDQNCSNQIKCLTKNRF